jgi:protein involved in polysaccharide export with SLBB domain
MGFHNENDCYLCSKHFIDPALQRHINIYNEHCGDKHPSSHKLKPWQPKSIPPFDFVKDKPSEDSTTNNCRHHNKHQKPFTNHSNKSKPSINALQSNNEQDIDINAPDEVDDQFVSWDDLQGPPTISSFISSQRVLTDNLQLQADDDDDFKAINCSMSHHPNSNHLVLPPSPAPFDHTHGLNASSTVQQFTPSELQDIISTAHPNQHPRKSFFVQHSADLMSLPNRTF